MRARLTLDCREFFGDVQEVQRARCRSAIEDRVPPPDGSPGSYAPITLNDGVAPC